MSNSTRRMRRSLALAIVAGALAAPASSAAPIDPVGGAAPIDPVGGADQTQGSEQSPSPSINAVLGSDGMTAPTSVLAAAPQTEADGFDWGDAGIGAAAVVAVGAIGAGAALATGRVSRQRDVPQSAS
jgi:hypothetical protein